MPLQRQGETQNRVCSSRGSKLRNIQGANSISHTFLSKSANINVFVLWKRHSTNVIAWNLAILRSLLSIPYLLIHKKKSKILDINLVHVHCSCSWNALTPNIIWMSLDECFFFHLRHGNLSQRFIL